jgi:hypothetical protein
VGTPRENKKNMPGSGCPARQPFATRRMMENNILAAIAPKLTRLAHWTREPLSIGCA